MAKIGGDATIMVNLDMRCKRCSRDFLTCECPQRVQQPGQYGPVGGSVGSYAARATLCSHGLREGECAHCTWPKSAAQQMNELQDIANAEIDRLRAQLERVERESAVRLDGMHEVRAAGQEAVAIAKRLNGAFDEQTRFLAGLDDGKWSVPDRERRRALVRKADALLHGDERTPEASSVVGTALGESKDGRVTVRLGGGDTAKRVAENLAKAWKF